MSSYFSFPMVEVGCDNMYKFLLHVVEARKVTLNARSLLPVVT